MSEAVDKLLAGIGSLPEDELEHYGKLGMKWGHRKGGGSTHIGGPNLSVKAGHSVVNKIKANRSAKKTAFPAHPDHINVAELRNKPISSLSNKELGDLNKRLQLQRTNKELTKKKNPAVKGHDYIKGALGVAATATAVYSFAQSPLGKEIRSKVTAAVKSASK